MDAPLMSNRTEEQSASISVKVRTGGKREIDGSLKFGLCKKYTSLGREDVFWHGIVYEDEVDPSIFDHSGERPIKRIPRISPYIRRGDTIRMEARKFRRFHDDQLLSSVTMYRNEKPIHFSMRKLSESDELHPTLRCDGIPKLEVQIEYKSEDNGKHE
jgi:hypothetical protein